MQVILNHRCKVISWTVQRKFVLSCLKYKRIGILAIDVLNSITELRLLAASLGILRDIVPSGKDGKFHKDDYTIPIRNKILSNTYGTHIPTYLAWCNQIKAPMLTKRIDELNKDNQNLIWQDVNWYFEEKINGIRCLLIKDETGLHVVSRFNSKETLLPIELSVLFKNLNLGNIDNFMLDCELTSNNGNTCNYLSTKGLVAYDNTQALDLLRRKILRLYYCLMPITYCLFYLLFTTIFRVSTLRPFSSRNCTV